MNLSPRDDAGSGEDTEFRSVSSNDLGLESGTEKEVNQKAAGAKQGFVWRNQRGIGASE